MAKAKHHEDQTTHTPDSTNWLRKDLKEKWGTIPFSSLWAWYSCLSMSMITLVINDLCCYSSRFGRTSTTLLLRNELPSGSASGEGTALGGRAWVAPLQVSTLSTYKRRHLSPVTQGLRKLWQLLPVWFYCPSVPWRQNSVLLDFVSPGPGSGSDTPGRSAEREAGFSETWAKLRSRIFLVDVLQKPILIITEII